MSRSRCDECGSWEAECGSEKPVIGCGCARCANAEVRRLKKLLKDAEWNAEGGHWEESACPWCYHQPYGNGKHADTCATFTPDGRVK